jgi:hypothetical protein
MGAARCRQNDLRGTPIRRSRSVEGGPHNTPAAVVADAMMWIYEM